MAEEVKDVLEEKTGNSKPKETPKTPKVTNKPTQKTKSSGEKRADINTTLSRVSLLCKSMLKKLIFFIKINCSFWII